MAMVVKQAARAKEGEVSSLDLPEDWEIVRLGHVATYQKGSKPQFTTETKKEGQLPYLTAEYFRTGASKHYVELAANKVVVCDKDDIVLIWDGSNAGDVFTGLTGVLASTMVKIEPSDGVSKEFLYFYLKSKFSILNGRTTGSTIPHVSKSVFNNLDFPKPPIDEQCRIAQVLLTLQRAIEAQNKVIAATRQLKASLMNYLFTYGPVPFDQTDKVPLKETEIGTIPSHWKTTELGSLARIGNGSTPKRDNPKYWQHGTIPWLTSGKVHEAIINCADQFVTETARDECHLPLVKKGSLVVAITGQGKTLA